MSDEVTLEMMTLACADAIAKWNTTHNPLYVWDAIRWSLLSEQPLPQECRDYLLWCSAGLHDLAEGVDSSDCQFPVKHEDLPKITPTAALKRVTHALGFVSGTINAFVTFNSDGSNDKLANRFIELRSRALVQKTLRSDSEIYTQILEETGRSDERNLRRIVANFWGVIKGRAQHRG